jgi:hypothetical protein
MTSTYSTYIREGKNDEGLEFSYEKETVKFTCPICYKEQTHKMTVQFLLGQDEIRCPCEGTMIGFYGYTKLTVINYD